jgi:hypothetical protein
VVGALGVLASCGVQLIEPPPTVGTVVPAATAAQTAPPRHWAAADCRWALDTLTTDAQLDLTNRPPGVDTKDLDIASVRWRRIANLLRLTVCPQETDGGPLPDRSWYRDGRITPIGCEWATSGIAYGRESHTDHIAAIDSGRLTPYWNVSRADSDAWDRTWVDNYSRLLALLGSNCA